MYSMWPVPGASFGMPRSLFKPSLETNAGSWMQSKTPKISERHALYRLLCELFGWYLAKVES